MQNLHALETWMLSVITDPAGVADASHVIHESDDWPAPDRMHVYWNAYFARLLECLRSEFPTLHSVLGDDAFDELARGYLEAHPPQSYTLSQLGATFSHYLAATRPPRVDDAPDWADFLIDLAAYEWTLSEVFDGPGSEGLAAFSAAEIATVPADRWLECTFVIAPCLKLRSYRFPVHLSHAAVRSGETLAMPRPEASHVAVTRRNYIVRHHALGRDEFRLLELLGSGTSLGDALNALLDEGVPEAIDVTGSLADWFQRWTRAGFLVGVNLPQ